MRRLIIILTLLFYYNCFAQTTDSTNNDIEELEPYDSDTILKRGYTISFKADDSLEYLYLKKGNKIIVELSSCSRGLPYKNLGYVAADFKDYFVLAHSFGLGNPNSIKDWAAWIDAVVDKEFLLYSENDVPGAKDKMILLNIKTGQKKLFSFPS